MIVHIYRNKRLFVPRRSGGALLFLVLCAAALTGCVPKKTADNPFVATAPDGARCADLVRLPQDLMPYAQKAGLGRVLLAPEEQATHAANAERRFFQPWRVAANTPAQRQSLHNHFRKSLQNNFNMTWEKGFTDNLRQFTEKMWADLEQNADAANYPSRAEAAITVRNTNLRAMPTARPYFLNPDQAGEGYPFDYFQHTALWIGTPVFISHVSKDGKWVAAHTWISLGWLPAEDVAVVDEAFQRRWRSLPLAAVIKDNTVLRDERDAADTVTGKRGTARAHIGALFPLASTRIAAPVSTRSAAAEALHPADQAGRADQTGQADQAGRAVQTDQADQAEADRSQEADGQRLRILFPKRSKNGKAEIGIAAPDPGHAAVFPLPVTPGGIARVGNEMMGQPYGWGGLFEHRDCSALTRDLLLPFGFFMPRNSTGQGDWGTAIDLAGLEPDEKDRRILSQAVPFFSLVWLRGHIGLYLGAWEGKPVMYHNIWGLRVNKTGPGGLVSEGRSIIGKAVVTTLRPGAELPEISHPTSLLHRIDRISVLPEKEKPKPTIVRKKGKKAQSKKAVAAKKTSRSKSKRR